MKQYLTQKKLNNLLNANTTRKKINALKKIGINTKSKNKYYINKLRKKVAKEKQQIIESRPFRWLHSRKKEKIIKLFQVNINIEGMVYCGAGGEEKFQPHRTCYIVKVESKKLFWRFGESFEMDTLSNLKQAIESDLQSRVKDSLTYDDKEEELQTGDYFAVYFNRNLER